MKAPRMETLLIVGGFTLAMFAAWIAARRATQLMNADYDVGLDFSDPDEAIHDQLGLYVYSHDPEPEGVIVEVFDGVHRGTVH